MQRYQQDYCEIYRNDGGGSLTSNSMYQLMLNGSVLTPHETLFILNMMEKHRGELEQAAAENDHRRAALQQQPFEQQRYGVVHYTDPDDEVRYDDASSVFIPEVLLLEYGHERAFSIYTHLATSAIRGWELELFDSVAIRAEYNQGHPYPFESNDAVGEVPKPAKDGDPLATSTLTPFQTVVQAIAEGLQSIEQALAPGYEASGKPYQDEFASAQVECCHRSLHFAWVILLRVLHFIQQQQQEMAVLQEKKGGEVGSFSLTIPATIKQTVIRFLLERDLSFFTFCQSAADTCVLEMPATHRDQLLRAIAAILEEGVEDDAAAAAWFRYKGILISHVSDLTYSYRVSTPDMDEAKSFDVRTLTTWTGDDGDLKKCIMAAIDSHELFPEAHFLEVCIDED